MEPSPAPTSDAIATAAAGADANVETRRAATPAWLISVVTHSAILAVFSTVVFLTRDLPSEAPPVRPVRLDPIVDTPKPKTLDPVDTRITMPDLPIDAPVDDVTSPYTDLAVDDNATTSEDEVPADVQKGDPNAVADMQLTASDGVFMAIGTNGGDKGMWGDPNGGGVKKAIRKRMTTIIAEKSVERALRWFKRHQSVDGRWDVDGYQNNCTEPGAKCEPGTDHTGGDGDIACTGYAVLCYLSHGYDHRMPSRYRATVRKGVDWLVANQKADGSWGERNYENAIATLALADAYGMSNDPSLRDAVQKGVQVILSRQAKEGDGGYGLGWDYIQPNPKRIDASVSGWNVMALKSARAAGIDVGAGFEGAKNYLNKAWAAANPNGKQLDVYKDCTSFPYTWDSTSGAVDIAKPGASEHDMAAVGALCAVFLGHKAGDPMLETLCNHIVKYQSFTAWPVNTYYLYYDSLALAQIDTQRYLKWAVPVRDLLTQAQRDGGCFDGSWDFAGTQFPGHDTGRLLSTAYCCLALEASYHYQGAQAEHERDREKTIMRTVAVE